MSQQQELIGLLNSHLWQLGWTWKHPRIQSYLKIVEGRLLLFEIQTIEQIPIEYLQRLVKLTELYYHCDRLLKMMKKSWEDEDITKIVEAYGYVNRMPLKGYEELKKFLDDVWYNNYGF